MNEEEIVYGEKEIETVAFDAIGRPLEINCKDMKKKNYI